tara:strand:+ start:370 stop:543 length:174 start_codon:yes stop_codon:yes gene_type:complete
MENFCAIAFWLVIIYSVVFNWKSYMKNEDVNKFKLRYLLPPLLLLGLALILGRAWGG